MYLTPIRIIALALPAVLALAACGQVTGLSDDYQYDLVDGGTSPEGAADGAATDGPAAADAAKQCTPAQTLSAAKRLNQDNGTQLCKTCLASSCCIDVDTCAANNECSRLLSCKVDCTEKTGADRTQCLKSCNSNSTSALFNAGVGACAAAACSKECAFN